jgi:hypothetical protein
MVREPVLSRGIELLPVHVDMVSKEIERIFPL